MSSYNSDIEYLLSNDSFLRWINGKADQNEQEKWESWLREDPARRHLVREARYLYRSLRFREEVPDTDQALDQLYRKLEARDQHQFIGKPTRGKIYYWASAAAVIILLVAISIIVKQTSWQSGAQTQQVKQEYTTVQTRYGQIRRLTLSDGSTIVLNAHSRLSYPASYKGGNIEVRLEGEAYFSIIHKTGKAMRTFTVTTPEGQIEVLGTKFNVNTRHKDTEVVLQAGSVHLEGRETLSGSSSYTMKPGERAILFPGEDDIKVETVDPELYTSWQNFKLKFHNTSLKEIAQRIEETYGIEVEFKNKKIQSFQFSGSAPNRNVDVLLEGLRILLPIPISHEKNKIVFGQ